MRHTPIQRFQRKYEVREDTGCWDWTGCRDGEPRSTSGNPRGRYGRFALDGYRMIGAHRASYLLFRGPIPSDKEVCHTCDNPGCVNPAHLFLGTRQQNSDDKLAKGRSWHQKAVNPPRLGTGVGRNVPGKGCVVDATCAMCETPMLQRITAHRFGKTAVCSPRCKAAFNARRQRNRVEVPCAECGAPTWQIPHNLKKNKRHFCSQPCVGAFYARQRRAC